MAHIIPKGAIRDNETRPCTWSELTGSEQREAINRGFPRERDTLYIPRKSGDKSPWLLSRWTRNS